MFKPQKFIGREKKRLFPIIFSYRYSLDSGRLKQND